MRESFKRENKSMRKLEGISFVTPLGETFSKIEIDYPENNLSVLKVFSDRKDLKEVINKSRHFKEQFPGTFNGILLGNPKITIQNDGSLSIQAERLHYQTYFAAHELRKNKSEKMGEKYCALSICGIVYDSKRQSFYLSTRPGDSQEDPGKLDAPGGVLNPDFEKADPFKTAESRFAKKLDLGNLQILSIGVERVFDDKYSLYNIAMYSEVNNRLPAVDKKSFAEIPLSEVEEYLKSNKLTAPARATLLLALSQDKFKDAGWGKEKIELIINE